MRLRSLRRLEEMEIRQEHKALAKERKDIQALLKEDNTSFEGGNKSGATAQAC